MTDKYFSEDERDSAKPLRASLDKLATTFGLGDVETIVAIFQGWNAAVGETISCHATPVSLDGTVLVVEADNHQWATQIRLLAPQILRSLADGHPGPVATEVRVVTRRKRSTRN